MEHWDFPRIVKALTAGMASIATFLFGQADGWLMTLLAFVVIDYISGVVSASLRHELSSKVGFQGILKKMMYFFVVAVAHCIDAATGAGGVLRNLTVGFLLANEGISILENCAKCGIPIPERLLKTLAQIKGEESRQ